MERFVISLVDDDGLVAANIFEWSILKVLLSGVFSLSIECSIIVRSYPAVNRAIKAIMRR